MDVADCCFPGNKLPVHWHMAEGKKWKEGHRVKVTHPKVNSPNAFVSIYCVMLEAMSPTCHTVV